MPRPRQRRGADAKKEEKQAKRERIEQEAQAAESAAKRARYTKSAMPWSSLDVAKAGAPVAVDPDALPEPDPDTKAYFRQISEKISELEALGHGRGTYGTGEDGEEVQEDERPLLLRSALESLAGHEIPLAGDGDTSIVLERLLYAMDDFARRVLADRFAGNYEKLVKHRSASHVLQTLFTLAGETVDRETRGIIAPAPISSSSNSSASSLPTMTDILLSALNELLPVLPTLLYDPFGSHTIRILLLIFSGAPPTEEGRLGSERSKKSLKWRKGQGPMKSFLAGPEEGAGAKKEPRRRVPPAFGAALVQMWESLNGLDEDGPKGAGVRRAAMDDVAGPAVRIMLAMEAEEAGGWQTGGWADRVLYGLVEEVADPTTADEGRTARREEYLGGLLRHPASSPTFETLLTAGSQALFEALWTGMFVGKLHRLAGNAVANFVVAKGIGRLGKDALADAVRECQAVGTERRGEWIDNLKTGVLRSLLERSAELKVCEMEMSEMMLDTFQVGKPEDRKLVVPCVLSLNRIESFKKLPTEQTPQPSTQGSILLQSWLLLSSPHQQVVIDSINSLGVPGIILLSRDATSSRVLDSLLSSRTTPPREIRKFLLSMLGHYHTLADDRIGSRVVERCWATADVYLKDKIAASLVDQANFLQASQYGHFFARKVELPLFGRRREEWKLKMANGGVALPKKEAREAKDGASVAVEESKKRRERPVDEVDEIFAAKGAKRGKGDVGGSDLPKKSLAAAEGMEEIFGALQASAAV